MPDLEYPKRLIEVDLPIKEISKYARQEKDSRIAHIPRLHIYPAARPLAACRAVTLASLLPDPVGLYKFDSSLARVFIASAKSSLTRWIENTLVATSDSSYKNLIAIHRNPEKLEKPEVLRSILLNFISEFSVWKNSHNRFFLTTAEELVFAGNKSLNESVSNRPFVFDPFAGGGAIPLEAVRVGADALSTDLNPVAVLIEKVVLEFLPKYGTKLGDELNAWVSWAQGKAIKEIGCFYPPDVDGAVPVAYLWARTILSEAPEETGQPPVEIPMMRSMWLSRKKNRPRALRWLRDDSGNIKCEKLEIEYLGGSKIMVRRPLLEIFAPKSPKEVGPGTAARMSATCPISEYTTPAKNVEAQLKLRKGGASDARLYCVVRDIPGDGRDFRISTDLDIATAQAASHKLNELVAKASSNFTLVPDEPLHEMSGVFNAPIYGHDTWGSLFNPRQLLSLVVYSQLAKEYVKKLATEDSEYSKAFAAMVGLVIDRLADLNAAMCVWQLNTPNTAHVFGRWALPMVLDYGEVNPLAGAGGSPESAVRRANAFIRDFENTLNRTAQVYKATATDMPLPDDSVDLLFTDPPYYNAVPYADIMDFFYVWLKRSVGEFFPELFLAAGTPKEQEICEMSGWDPVRYQKKDKQFFEDQMTLAFSDARRVVKPSGIGVCVFAHKSTSGWEAMLQGLINAGWVITASWPIDTEMDSRLRAKNSAALASSVHIVMRPRENPDGSLRTDAIGDWRDVLQELPERIHSWMPRMADEGIVGADAIFACLGPALEIFSRYSHVEKTNGNKVALREYLEHIWAAVSKEALNMIFEDADANGLEEDARLTAMWLWTISTATINGDSEGDTEIKSTGYEIEYDAARKIAQGLGAHLEDLPHLVEVRGDKARLFPVSERIKYLFGKDEVQTTKTQSKKESFQSDLFAELIETEEETSWGITGTAKVGDTLLDRIHQGMILFAAGRGEALKRFLVEEGIGRDQRFWSLAQALSALYPAHTDEKRWVDGVLARKKGLGL